MNPVMDLSHFTLLARVPVRASRDNQQEISLDNKTSISPEEAFYEPPRTTQAPRIGHINELFCAEFLCDPKENHERFIRQDRFLYVWQPQTLIASLEELTKSFCAEDALAINLSTLYYLLLRQAKGTKGPFQVNGERNTLFVQAVSGKILNVAVCWENEGWSLLAYDLSDADQLRWACTDHLLLP
ncbi:MAG: hypothetical protein UT02_C0001G0019 [Parcubacteria group bacterium GW2011_GWC2_38_7]|nr:MAG: hypothetical protein UT02_C0001G0019 [Parcubacteria group bacterium GW2011_GWC2_38_7]